MKNLFTIILLIIFICNISTLAQREWVQQNSGTNSHLRAVDFVNENTGYVAGDGVLLKTTDGGTNWMLLTQGGRDIDFLNESLFPQ